MNNHVTSLETSKKLKEAGVEQASMFWWNMHDSPAGGYDFELGDYALHLEDNHGGYETYSAFTLSELIELCGDELDLLAMQKMNEPEKRWVAAKDRYKSLEECYFGSTPIEAVASLLLALKEKK